MCSKELVFLLVFLVNLHFGLLKKYPFQLSEDVKPIEYDLFIFPNLTYGTYKGRVSITVNTTKDISSITLHSKKLQIVDVAIDFEKAKHSTNAAYDFLTLYKSRLIYKGIHNITINFNGDMKNKTYGFFRGYEKVKRKKIYFGTTLFEPINARVAFPCFDEPTLKARFTIHVFKPPGYIALSNMNVIKETGSDQNYTIVHFAKTPLMSTYLVTFFVGNYGYCEEKYIKSNGDIVPVRVYTPPSKLHNVGFAVKQIPKILKWFVNYTGFDFMLPKLDYVTFNSKFHIAGGMENWGMTTTLETSIFYNNRMSVLQKSKALNMAHEFSHIWFGDLLTTSSWGEFWLNEGFTRFMDMKSAVIYPQSSKEYLNKFNVLQSALWLDDQLSIKPLKWELRNLSDSYDILNSINYDKGGSILGMVEDLVGEPTMKSALQTYISKYQYRNVRSQDFMDVLQNFVGFNVTNFLNGFVEQPGYPLISVFQPSEKKILLVRTRFLRVDESKYQNERWTVPIKFTTELNPKISKLVWFPSNRDEITIKFPNKIKWIKLNSNHSGYYRVNYPKTMWKTFTRRIMDFDVRDRMNLIDDSFALIRGNKLKCSLAFDLTTYLLNEDKYEVWNAAQNGFHHVKVGLIQNNMSTEYLKRYISQIIDKQYFKNSWTVEKNESYYTKFARQTIFNLACANDHPHCLQRVQELWPIRKMLPVDIYNIVMANDPTKNHTVDISSEDGLMELSSWFGADISQLRPKSQFKWPKSIIEECDEWLKNKVG